MLALHAASAFIAAGMAKDFPGGIELARQTMQTGKAVAKLEALVAKSKSFGEGD
jgi:anthranilate phosphoribosyltransferase